MAELRTPWSYKSGNSFLHKTPAFIKLIALIAFSAAVLALPGRLALRRGAAVWGAAAVLLCVLSLAAKLKPRQLLRGIRPLFIMVAFVAVFRSVNLVFNPLKLLFDKAGFFEAARFALALFLTFAASSLYFAVTTMGELRRSLPNAKLALALSLMLGFLPRFFALWEEAELSCEARSFRRGIKRTAAILLLVTERMIERAAETAAALESRGLDLRGRP